MYHASGAVTPLNPEMVQVGNAVGQRAQRRGLLEGSVRPVGVIEVFVVTQDGHQVPLVPDQGSVQQLAMAAADPVRAVNVSQPLTWSLRRSRVSRLAARSPLVQALSVL